MGHADETDRDREYVENELESCAQNRVDGVERFAMSTSACMGGEAESALVRAPRFSTNGPFRQGRRETVREDEVHIDFIQSGLQN